MISKKIFYILIISSFSVFILDTTLNAGNYLFLAGYAQKKKEKRTVNILDVCKGDYRGVGCPDTDGDGIPDHSDKCPNIPGPTSGQGCPDSDGDGIPDYMDDCPDAFGLPEFNGCPDTDGDGIPDNMDICPKEPGPKSNNGCPLVASKANSKQLDPEAEKNNQPQNKQEEQSINIITNESFYEYKDYADIDHSNKQFKIIEEILPKIETIPNKDIITNITPKDLFSKSSEEKHKEIKNVLKSDYSTAENIILSESEKVYLNLILRKVFF